MIKISNRIFVLIAFLAISFQAKAQSGAPTIPDFTLYKQDQSVFTNQNLEKGKLLFFLFFDVKCEHCLHAIQTINSRYDEMENTNIHLVTLDKPDEVEAFLKKHGKNLLGKKNVMLFFDMKHEFIKKFMPRKYPSIFLYTPDHKLVIYDDNPANLPKFFEEIKQRSK